MVKFMNKVTKLALKTAAVCTGIAAGAALLHKYVKIQSNCGECKSKEDNFDEDLDGGNETINAAGSANTKENAEEFDAISSDEATESSNRRYINIHVTSQDSDVDISFDKGQLFDDAAKLVSDASQLAKNLKPGPHNSEEKADANAENEKTQDCLSEDAHLDFKDMDASNDIAYLDIKDLGVDIDEDLSESVSDLYTADGIEEVPVNSSIHL